MGQKIFLPRYGTMTTSGGTANETIRFKDGVLRQIIIQPATSTTTYDIKLTDVNNVVVYNEDDILGNHNDLSDLPCFNNWTLTIENASANEAFTYELIMEER